MPQEITVGSPLRLISRFSGSLSHSLSSSNPLVITPDSGVSITLESLVADTVQPIPNVTIKTQDRTIINSLSLAWNTSNTSSFNIVKGGYASLNAVDASCGYLSEVQFNEGDIITIETTEQTASNVFYSFSEVENV